MGVHAGRRGGGRWAPPTPQATANASFVLDLGCEHTRESADGRERPARRLGTGALSRNRRVGIELGKGRGLAEILASTRMVAEGVGTAAALLTLAREYAIELPITEQVNAILHHGKPPREAIATIMEHPQKHE